MAVMKGSEQFKKTIKSYLDDFASKDSVFNEKYQSDKKNIDDCITYILNQVKSSGVCGFADDEIYGMALHYYDEEEIDVGKPIKASVVVNHQVELTEEEKEKAKRDAISAYQSKCVEEYKQKTIRTTKPVVSTIEKKEEPVLTLF